MQFMTYDKSWQIKHSEIIYLFLTFLSSQTKDFILKGGTALHVCYELDRFSEVIDLDAKSQGVEIESFIKQFASTNNCLYRIAKNTDTVKRYMINYGNSNHPLKIEISFRNKNISKEEFAEIKGIVVYALDALSEQKSIAYSARDRIRDLYDLTFICKRWWDILSVRSKSIVRTAIQHKGLEQCDYIMQNQDDKLINKSKLADDFLEIYDKIGLLSNEEDKIMLKETQNK